jgi:hypothetical protein
MQKYQFLCTKLVTLICCLLTSAWSLIMSVVSAEFFTFSFPIQIINASPRSFKFFTAISHFCFVYLFFTHLYLCLLLISVMCDQPGGCTQTEVCLHTVCGYSKKCAESIFIVKESLACQTAKQWWICNCPMRILGNLSVTVHILFCVMFLFSDQRPFQ